MSSSADRLSRLRQSLRQLQDEIADVLGVFLRRESLVAGSVYELRRKCGKPSCSCASGETLHSCMAITWRDGNRKRLRSLSPKEEMELKALTENYRRFREARARVVSLNAKMLKVIDQIEAARRKEP
jgi:hypothetical protein